MDVNFLKFKKKILIEALIKNSVISLSFGILSFSILFILNKLSIINLELIFSILISICFTLILFAILFLVFRPKNMKVAKRIDNQFNLNEKVQTMLAFKDENGDIYQLQRDDARDKLSKISIKNLKMKFNFIHYIIPILALVLCITSIAIPAKANDDINDDEPPVLYDDEEVEWYIVKINNLINYVNDSDIQTELKPRYVAELEGLISDIEMANNMKDIIVLAAEECITDIEIITNLVNSNNEIAELIRPEADQNIIDFSKKLSILDEDSLANILNNMRSTLQVQYDPQNPDGQQEALEKFYSIMVSRLRDSNKVGADDPLYLAIKQLGDELLKCINATNVHPAIALAFDQYSDDVLTEIIKQKKIQNVNDYVVYELKNLFDIIDESGPIIDDNIIDDDTNSNTSIGDTTTESDTDPNNNSGGMGTGDLILGSDELVYDPELGSVLYKEVIDKYYQSIMAKFDEGLIDEENKELFEKYFAKLYGVSNEEN